MPTKIIDRYIARVLLSAVCAVLIGICALDFLFGFLDELSLVNDAGYGPLQVLVYVALQIPKRMFEFTPVSVLIGSLVGLGVLASQSELVVLRATGLSVVRIVLIGCKAVLWVLVFNFALVQWLIPEANLYAQSYRAVHLSEGGELKLRSTNWQKDGDDIIHFQHVKSDGTMVFFTRFEFDEQFQLASVTRARQAVFERAGRWRLEDFKETRFTPNQVFYRQAELESWYTQLTPTTLLKLVLNPSYLSVTALWEYMSYLEALDLNVQQHKLVFWKKVLSPGVTLVMFILASSFLFGSLRSATMGFRVTVGIVFGLLYRYLQDFLGFSSLVYQVDPLWAALIPLIIFLTIGWVNLRRVS